MFTPIVYVRRPSTALQRKLLLTEVGKNSVGVQQLSWKAQGRDCRLSHPQAKSHLSPRLGDPGLEEQVQPAFMVFPRGLHRNKDVLQL